MDPMSTSLALAAAFPALADYPGFWLPLATVALVGGLLGAKLLVQQVGRHGAERERDERRRRD
jgi:hypothetical protein